MKFRSSKPFIILVLMVLNTALSKTTVLADPIILLTNASDFSTAIQAGYITNFDPTATDSTTRAALAALSQIYTDPTSAYGTTSVSADFGIVNGMKSTVTGGILGAPVIGTTDIKKTDPDYTNFTFDLIVYVNAIAAGTNSDGFDSVSFAAIDINQKTKYWTWSAPVLTTGFNSFHVNFSDGNGAGGSTGFNEQQGFDLTHVDMLQISFRGQYSGTNGLSLGTHELVVPEPGAFTVIGMGLCLGTATYRMRRRNKR